MLRKGSTEFVTVPLGVIFFIAIIIGLMFFVQTSLLKLTSDLGKSVQEMQAVDATHILKKCFENGNRIQASYLAELGGKPNPLCDPCKICFTGIGAKVEYLESLGNQEKKAFNFGFREQDAGITHKIFITVEDADKSYVSRLTVKIY